MLLAVYQRWSDQKVTAEELGVTHHAVRRMLFRNR